jgi:hypothetical protein
MRATGRSAAAPLEVMLRERNDAVQALLKIARREKK